MDDELLLLIKKHTDTLIEQAKTKPQETLEFKMIKQMQTFSFNPPINLIEEGKWLMAVSLFDCTNSVFNVTNENNSYIEKDYHEFNLQHNKQNVEVILIQRADKTTIQILYDKGLFDNYANADKVLEDFLFTTRLRGDLSEDNT